MGPASDMGSTIRSFAYGIGVTSSTLPARNACNMDMDEP